MLLGRRQIAVVTVGQLDTERRLERAPGLDCQAGAAIDLAGHGHNPQLAEADRLELQFSDGGHLIHVQCFEGVNLGDALRFAPRETGEEFLGGGHFFRLWFADAKSKPRLGHHHRRPVVVLDCLVGLIGRLSGILADAEVVELPRRIDEIETVGVAAGAVGHDAHEFVAAADQFLDPPGKHAEVVGRDCRRTGVMGRVVAQHGQRLAVSRLYGNDRDIGIGRTGPLDGIGILMAGVHLRLVIGRAAEGIGGGGARLHAKAAAEDVLRILAHRPTDPRRREPGLGCRNALGNLSREPRRIGLVARGAEYAHHRRAGVRMCRRNQHSLDGNPRLLMGQALGFLLQFQGDHAAINHRDGDRTAAIVEHQAPGVKRVDDFVGQPFGEPAVDEHGQLLGRDIDRISPRAKHPLGQFARRRDRMNQAESGDCSDKGSSHSHRMAPLRSAAGLSHFRIHGNKRKRPGSSPVPRPTPARPARSNWPANAGGARR